MNGRPQNIKDFFAGQGRGGAKRRENPETPVTREIRGILRQLGVPHIKHWGGPFSEKGVSDLIGTVPGGPQKGRAFYCEVKVPGKSATAEQAAFLAEHEAAGALCMVGTNGYAVIRALAGAQLPAAVSMAKMLPAEL